MRIDAAELDAERTYRLLSGIIVPRPIAWITTQNACGSVNLAPFSAFTYVSNKPPMIGVNIGRKAGVRKDTAVNMARTGEFVVNIGDQTMVEQIHMSAEEHPVDVSEVTLLGLDVADSQLIRTPRLAMTAVSMECKLHSVIPFGLTGSEFHVGEIVAFHVRDGLLIDGKIDTRTLNPVCRLGGPNYAGLGEVITLRAIKQTAKTVIAESGEQ